MTNLIQIRYVGSPCKYLLPVFFRFRSTLKFKVVHIRKIYYFHFLKNCSNDFYQILWIYCTFEPQQYDTIGFSRKKILVTRIIFFKFLCRLTLRLNHQTNIVQIRYLGHSWNYLQHTVFIFDLSLKLREVYLRNKQTNSVTNMEFYKHVQYCFFCYVIISRRDRQ